MRTVVAMEALMSWFGFVQGALGILGMVISGQALHDSRYGQHSKGGTHVSSLSAGGAGGMGVILIILGCLSFSFNLIDVCAMYAITGQTVVNHQNCPVAYSYEDNGISLKYLDYPNGYTGYGFWGGIFAIVAGSVGVSSCGDPTRAKVISFLTMCCISFLVSVGPTAGGAAGASGSMRYANTICANDQCTGQQCSEGRLIVAMESLMSIFGFLQMVFAAAAIGIAATAIDNDEEAPRSSAHQPHQPQQQVYSNQGFAGSPAAQQAQF